MVRQSADGESQKIFLCHGTPGRPDQLADVYSNRPFHWVFEVWDQTVGPPGPEMGNCSRRVWDAGAVTSCGL